MNKKYIAFNTHLIFCILLFAVFFCIFISCAMEKEIVLCIISAIFALFHIFVFVISPLYFVFSDECVEIIYNFGQRERIMWNSIRDIYLMGNWFGRTGGSPRYVIAYPRKGKKLFFINGEIPKTRKTKKLIEKYYKKKID